MGRFRLLLFTFLCFGIVNADGQITFDGKKAAIDNLTSTWLISVPRVAFGADYQASVSLDGSVSLCKIDDKVVTDSYTFTNVQPGATYHLMMVRRQDTIHANIQFTHWPVIQIYGNYVKKPYRWGTVIYTHPDSTGQESIMSRIRWAGSSTAGSERNKHNFHLKFYNDDGSKKDMSFFGLRSDFHWRLDAGQVDFARVRNRVAKDIWADFANPPYYAAYEPKKPYNYVRGDFVEVFLNDQYMGIYSLNEHMDRQQLKLKKYDYENGVFHGGLWKPMTKTWTTLFMDMPSIDANQKSWDEFYVKYPNIDDVTPTNFQTLKNAIYFAATASQSVFLDSVKYYFDIPVLRDYYLFLILLTAPDNVGKNVYYACYDIAEEHPRLTMAIWDLDCTQGQYWSNEGSYYHNVTVGPTYDFKNSSLKNHNVFKRLMRTDSTFHGMATERYWALRQTVFNPDSIVARYKAYFDEMKSCGADQREIARWSYGSDLGGRELNFDTELTYLRDWWTRHIAYLDEKVFVPYPMGDVNFDHRVDIVDVTSLISYLLGGDGDKINPVRADLNGDDVISIQDVTKIIEMLMSSIDAE